VDEQRQTLILLLLRQIPIGLFTSCSGTQYLGADGACHTASGGAVDDTAFASSWDTVTATAPTRTRFTIIFIRSSRMMTQGNLLNLAQAALLLLRWRRLQNYRKFTS
jgi:hypothetical protein